MTAEKNFTTLVLGDLGNNCYLVPGPVTGKLYIIDPADEAHVIVEAAKKYTYNEAVILLTHAHVDHIQACGKVAEALGIRKLYLHEGDHKLYWSKENALLPYLPAVEDQIEDSPYETNEDFEVIHTPGHTPGGVCLLFKEYNTLFTGDTLFQNSIGRTDFPGGDYEDLLSSIREKLLPLEEGLKICPGHMGSSTIGAEKRSNPYLR